VFYLDRGEQYGCTVVGGKSNNIDQFVEREVDHRVLNPSGVGISSVSRNHGRQHRPQCRRVTERQGVRISQLGASTDQSAKGTVLIHYQLEPLGGGTRLTLWHNIDRRFISWGAAGWHICFDVLDRLLSGSPIGRIAGGEAMKFGGWQRLKAEYARQFGTGTVQS